MVINWIICSKAIISYPHFESDNIIFCRNQIKLNLPEPVTNDTLQQFVHMIYLSQINQAMTLKGISDVCRVHSSVKMIDPRTSQGYYYHCSEY